MSDVNCWALEPPRKLLRGITMCTLSILIVGGAVLSVSSIFT